MNFHEDATHESGRSWFRAIQSDGTLYAESSDPDEIVDLTRTDLYYQVSRTWTVREPWQPWTPAAADTKLVYGFARQGQRSHIVRIGYRLPPLPGFVATSWCGRDLVRTGLVDGDVCQRCHEVRQIHEGEIEGLPVVVNAVTPSMPVTSVEAAILIKALKGAVRKARKSGDIHMLDALVETHDVIWRRYIQYFPATEVDE